MDGVPEQKEALEILQSAFGVDPDDSLEELKTKYKKWLLQGNLYKISQMVFRTITRDIRLTLKLPDEIVAVLKDEHPTSAWRIGWPAVSRFLQRSW